MIFVVVVVGGIFIFVFFGLDYGFIFEDIVLVSLCYRSRK